MSPLTFSHTYNTSTLPPICLLWTLRRLVCLTSCFRGEFDVLPVRRSRRGICAWVSLIGSLAEVSLMCFKRVALGTMPLFWERLTFSVPLLCRGEFDVHPARRPRHHGRLQ